MCYKNLIKDNRLNVTFFNCEIERTTINALIQNIVQQQGHAQAVEISERIKGLGFAVAGFVSSSFNLEELTPSVDAQAFMRLLRICRYHGLSVKSHRFRLAWVIYRNYYPIKFDEHLAIEDNYSALFLFTSTGARGTLLQLRQIMFYRGLMMSAQSKVLRAPVRSCLSRGLTLGDLLISAFGARKGVIDTAVRTADAGYLTRRLIFAAQDLVIYEYDCGTKEGLILFSLFTDELTTSYYELYCQHARGRILARPIDIAHRIIPCGTELTDRIVSNLSFDEISKVNIRSVLTCNAVKGICSKCYGWHLGLLRLADIGDAVGILAAQSIGEPGTQLTLRTFHSGGSVVKKTKTIRVEHIASGTVSLKITKSRRPWLMPDDSTHLRQYLKAGNIKLTKYVAFSSFLTGHLMQPSESIFLKKEPKKHPTFFDPPNNKFKTIHSLLKRRKNKKSTAPPIIKANNMVYPPLAGIVKLYSNINQYDILTEDLPITIFSTRKIRYSGYLPVGSTLLIRNNQHVSIRDGLVSPKKPTLSLLLLGQIGGYLKPLMLEFSEVGNSQVSWDIRCKVYLFPKHFSFILTQNRLLKQEERLGSLALKTMESGILYFKNRDDIEISNTILVLYNGELIHSLGFVFLLRISMGKRRIFYRLTVHDTQQLITGHEVAYVSENQDCTKTGGIFYKKIPIRFYTPLLRINYWLPAEIHKFTPKAIEKLYVYDNDFINAGDLLVQNIYSRLAGVIFLNIKKRKLVIKAGLKYNCSLNFKSKLGQKNRFLNLIELVSLRIMSQKYVYMEVLKKEGIVILLRPAIRYFTLVIYYVARQIFSNWRSPNILTQPITRLIYEDGKEIKANTRTSLLKTSLKIYIKRPYRNRLLKAKVKRVFSKILGTTYYLLSFYLYIKSQLPIDFVDTDSFLTMFLERTIKDNQYCIKSVVVALASIYTSKPVILQSILIYGRRLKLILQLLDTIKYYNFNSKLEKPIVQLQQFINQGEFLTNRQRSLYGGKILRIYTNQIMILVAKLKSILATKREKNQPNYKYEESIAKPRLTYELRADIDDSTIILKDITHGVLEATHVLEVRNEEKPCLFSPITGTLHQVNYGYRAQSNTRFLIKHHLTESLTSFILFFELVSKNSETLVVEIGQQVKGGEQLTDGAMDYHQRLINIFFQHLLYMTPLQACKKSLRSLYFSLLYDTTTIYIAQKVDTSVKHYEIIIQNMTSKVTICHGGDSLLLIGQILSLKDVEIITLTFITLKRNPPLYHPIVLGLSKAGMNTESFLTATSFQRTIQLLTEAAIEGKKDWMLGLKENVIMCRLSSVGTGFIGSQIPYRTQARELITFEKVNEFKRNILAKRRS